MEFYKLFMNFTNLLGEKAQVSQKILFLRTLRLDVKHRETLDVGQKILYHHPWNTFAAIIPYDDY